MQIYVLPRQAGKTHRLVEWVLAGEKTDAYPGWSRILLVHSVEECNRLRRHYPALDFHQVFSVSEWQRTRFGTIDMEIGLDNADMVLAALLGRMPSVVTMTGQQA
jgi:hypothetical protein